MSARDIPTLYTQLIIAAERVMNRGSALATDEELVDLNERIEAAVRLPVEDRRLIFDEEKLLARCLLRVVHARRHNEPARVRLWLQIAGVLLPEVRDHLAAALEARRVTRVAGSDQDYFPSRR